MISLNLLKVCLLKFLIWINIYHNEFKKIETYFVDY